MRSFTRWSALLLLLPGSLAAQETYKVEELKKAPPSSISPEIAPALIAQGYRIVDGQGKPFADLWLRQSIPATSVTQATRAP